MFILKNNWTENHFIKEDIEHVKIPELQNHVFYKNGEVWNGKKFLTFSKSDNYLTICTITRTYKVHRLICYAFNPIEGKTKLSDYDDLQVNHKDGNTFNNNADNLEWVSNSDNMYHSYSQNLNKKVRSVLQYSLDGDFIKEFKSIAEASRETKEPEHRIRMICQNKPNSKALFIWKFKNDDETAEFKKKYSLK